MTIKKRGRPQGKKRETKILAVYLPLDLADWCTAEAERLDLPVTRFVEAILRQKRDTMEKS